MAAKPELLAWQPAIRHLPADAFDIAVEVAEFLSITGVRRPLYTFLYEVGKLNHIPGIALESWPKMETVKPGLVAYAIVDLQARYRGDVRVNNAYSIVEDRYLDLKFALEDITPDLEFTMFVVGSGGEPIDERYASHLAKTLASRESFMGIPTGLEDLPSVLLAVAQITSYYR